VKRDIVVPLSLIFIMSFGTNGVKRCTVNQKSCDYMAHFWKREVNIWRLVILFMCPLWQVKSSNQIGNVPWNSQKMNSEFRVLRASPSVLSMWSCTVKLDEEKFKSAGLAQENGFWLRIIIHYTVTGKRHSNAVHLEKNGLINIIWLLISVSDWPIILIGLRVVCY
jgi:hypothetical protein